VSHQRPEGATVVATLQALLAPTDGGTPRIAAARPDQLRPLPRIVAKVAGRVTGTGPANIFTTLGQHPRLFRVWLRYSAQLMPFGKLPRRDTELVILRVAWRCLCAYEWHQHVPIALRVGLTAEEVKGVAVSLPANHFTLRQLALLAASDELLAQRVLSDSTWRAVEATLDTREVIELCLLVGNYQGLASTIGGLGIQIEPDPARVVPTHRSSTIPRWKTAVRLARSTKAT
jgi:alkylhydroperoxidase family enzyme